MVGTGRGRASQRRGSNASLRSSPRSVALGSKAPRPEQGIALPEWPDHDPGVGSFATPERSACGPGSESEHPQWHRK
eukprot:291083-Pyramimonas_sp.AAC.1